MRTLLLLFMIGIPTLSMAQLEQHRWQDRVILLFAHSEQEKDLKKQLQDLEADSAGLKDRDLVIYRIIRNGVVVDKKLNREKSIQLQERYNIDSPHFKIILIGKDGGEKVRQYKPITREELFAIIDGMPMRRAEMRRNPKGN